MARLWGSLAQRYGHRFTANFGPSDDGTWTGELMQYTPTQVAAALEQLRKAYPDQPPNCFQFSNLVSGKMGGATSSAAYRPVQLGFEAKRDRSVGRAALDEMRAMQGMPARVVNEELT